MATGIQFFSWSETPSLRGISSVTRLPSRRSSTIWQMPARLASRLVAESHQPWSCQIRRQSSKPVTGNSGGSMRTTVITDQVDRFDSPFCRKVQQVVLRSHHAVTVNDEVVAIVVDRVIA